MLPNAERQEGAFYAATGQTVSVRQHSAVPLSEATQTLYERLAALKTQWQTERTLALRYEIASVTQELWKVARNGNHDKDRLQRGTT